MNCNDEFSETGQYLGTMPTRAEAEAVEAECRRAMEATKHLDPPVPVEMTIYLNPTSREMDNWQREGRCMWCGGKCPGDQCRLRKCDSCSALWVANTLADVSEGYQVTKEYCPPCQQYLNHVHARDPHRPDHVICGSKIDPEIKVAGWRWGGWCIWTDRNRRDFFVTAETREEAVRLIIAEATKVAPRPIFQNAIWLRKVGVTCPECLMVWNSLHLINPAPIFCGGDPL